MKNFGIGCGFFILIAIVLAVVSASAPAVLPSETGPNIIAYAFLIGIPVFIIAHFIEKFDRVKWYVWSAVWALSILLGTAVVSWIGSDVLTLFGLSLTAVPILLMIEAVLMALSGAMIFLLLPRIKARLEA